MSGQGQAAGPASFLDGLVKGIAVAEQIVKSPLFALVKDRLPEFGIKLTDAQKELLDANYASYVKAIKESKASEQTGRHKDTVEEVDADEGDTD